MDRNQNEKHYCKYLTLMQAVKSRLCTALSLPTVNAATLYKRITPQEGTNNDSEEETKREIKTDHFETEAEVNQSKTDTVVKSELEQEIEKYAALDAQMTGWERIKQAYEKDDKYEYFSAEWYDIFFTVTWSFALGFTYGGVPGLRLGKKRYIERSQAVSYETKFHAVSESYNASSRGLIRYGFRWGWRVAFVATSFQIISSCLSLYRNKVDIWNYAIAAGSTGAMYRLNLGLKGIVGGSVAGLVVGVPAGMSLLFLQRLAGESSLDRARRLRADYMLDFKKCLDITNERQIGAVKYMDEWLKEKDKSEQAKR